MKIEIDYILAADAADALLSHARGYRLRAEEQDTPLAGYYRERAATLYYSAANMYRHLLSNASRGETAREHFADRAAECCERAESLTQRSQ